jgi:tetratricopeptide (TPR) repeat protein
MRAFDAKALAVIAAAAVATAVWAYLPHRGSGKTETGPPIALLGSKASPSSTSRADLDRTIETMSARLTRNPADDRSAFSLADALLRETRVTGNAGLAVRAEAVLRALLKVHPDSYNARQMLGAVYLSQHRFREAIETAQRCQQDRPNDAWVYGVLGDAHLELGEYDAAFAAFDRMSALRPNAASYARASYARELQGDLSGAMTDMRMATDATSAEDPESLAWHHAQLGHLFFEMGRLDDAAREYAHADYVFPGHPFASEGLARVKAARGDYAGALAIVTGELATAPTPAGAALAGDLLAAEGRAEDAEREYRLAEAAWTSDAPDPSKLARFMAERRREPAQAVAMAERASADRQDIFTDDALAWAYFESGDLAKAKAASDLALRTGSRDREIRYHAAAIANARGQTADARRYLDAALSGSPRFDLISAPAAAALRKTLDAQTAGHESGNQRQ